MGLTSYVVALGSNRPGRHGGPEAELRAALGELPGLVACSRIIRSAPLGPSARRFANAAALIETELDPEELLALLKGVEKRWGRRSGQRWAARVIDLDIILWSAGSYRAPGLTIPHPAFRTRRFVLDPLVEIAPSWRDPLTGRSMRQLRARLTRPRPLPRCASAWVRSSVGRASDF